MFYKPDKCGLDFSGVPILFSAARFVLARLVFFFIIVFASSLPAPPSSLSSPSSSPSSSYRHGTPSRLCRSDILATIFLPLPRREANFCTNRSALKINVGWRHFILREKRSIAARSHLGIERLSRTLLPGRFTIVQQIYASPWDKEPPWLHSRPYTDTTER